MVPIRVLITVITRRPLIRLKYGSLCRWKKAAPWAEYNPRSIPGTTKIVAVAGPHHGQSFGSIVMIDQIFLMMVKCRRLRVSPLMHCFPKLKQQTTHTDTELPGPFQKIYTFAITILPSYCLINQEANNNFILPPPIRIFALSTRFL